MKSKFQHVLIFLLIATFSALGLKIGFGNIAIISIFSLSVIYAIIYKPKLSFKNHGFGLFTLFFVLYFLSALFSHDITQGFEFLEIRLMYILIPFPLMLISTFEFNRNRILSYFVIAITILSTILLIINGIKILSNGNFAGVFFHDFTALYKQHAVYYSMLLLFAIIILLENWNKEKMLFELTAFVILSIAMIFAASKIMLVLLAFFLVYYVFIEQHNKLLKFSFLAVLLLGVAAITFSRNLQTRFVGGLRLGETDFTLENRKFTYDEKQNISDLELRFLLAKVALKHMAEDQKVIMGYGLGDQQDWFDYHLMRYDLAPHWYMGHNVHNQYLDIWLNLGIFGLVFFLYLLYYFFKEAIRTQNRLWLIFLIVFAIAFIFEVYLSRNKGIVFFTLFNAYFYFNRHFIGKINSIKT